MWDGLIEICNFLIDNKEMVTFVIALIGFLLSVYNFVCELKRNHMRLKITYKNHLCGNTSPGFLLIMMNIENLSRLPVSISRMFLHIGEERFEFSSLPQFAYERVRRTGDEIHDKVVTHSQELPVMIPALGIVGGFFHICGNITEKLNSEMVTIELWTTRGKKKYSMMINNEVQHPN